MRVRPPGSGGDSPREPHLGELFTDRDSESGAFKAALASFRRELDCDADPGTFRRNVLVFHGLGGIGKTALSHRLESWVAYDLPLVNGWGPPPPTKVAATVRIDLHGSAGQMDVVAALLALRRGLSQVRTRWPVFDLAFAAYWSAIRPGEPLPAYRGADDISDSVVDTVKDVLGDVASLGDLVAAGTGAGLAVRGVRKLVGDLRRRRDLRVAVGAFDGFEGFLLRCADEPSPTEPRPALACEIAGVLAWELSSLTPCPLLTVFIDTTERLALDPRRTSEGHLNSLVHQLPNVLFVLTGRDQIDWYDQTRVELPHRGPWTWPGLVPGQSQEPRQHLVGGLSEQDGRSLVKRARRQLRLPMSDEVIDQLVTASAGLPQYLELARQVAISVRNAGGGRQVQVEDVTGSLGSLVMRVLDDVPADERRALRAASLFRMFDVDLVATAADVDHGCATRAVGRPMIDHHDADRMPYRMHDAVREAIRQADHSLEGGWSERDWELAATRAAFAARRLHDQAKAREDTRGVLDAVGIAISLVCDQETELELSALDSYEDWLSQAVVFSPSVQGLRSRAPGRSRTRHGQYVLDFITAKSLETPLEERLRLLRGVFASDHPLRLPAGRHLGYAFKQQYRFEEALTVFDEVVALAPTTLNRAQRPQTLNLARRFADAATAATGLPAAATVRRVAEYAHGRPERYFEEVDEKIRSLRAAGRQREVLEDEGDLLHRRAFFDGYPPESAIEQFREEAELAGHVVATRSALVTAVLQQSGSPSIRAVLLERLHVLDRASAPGPVGFRYAFAETCDAIIAGDRERLVRLHALAQTLPFRSRSWIPVDYFLAAVGLPLQDVPTQWLEPPDEVRRRWTDHLDAYLSRHGAVRDAVLAPNN